MVLCLLLWLVSTAALSCLMMGKLAPGGEAARLLGSLFAWAQVAVMVAIQGAAWRRPGQNQSLPREDRPWLGIGTLGLLVVGLAGLPIGGAWPAMATGGTALAVLAVALFLLRSGSARRSSGWVPVGCWLSALVLLCWDTGTPLLTGTPVESRIVSVALFGVAMVVSMVSLVWYMRRHTSGAPSSPLLLPSLMLMAGGTVVQTATSITPAPSPIGVVALIAAFIGVLLLPFSLEVGLPGRAAPTTP